MYTTFNYIWSRDAAGIYTGVKSKIKGTLPDAEVSQRYNTYTTRNTESRNNTKHKTIQCPAIVKAAHLQAQACYYSGREDFFCTSGD